MKFKSVEEIKKKRKELEVNFESDIPDYLSDYLDGEEEKILKSQFFKQKAIDKNNIIYNSTREERKEYINNKNEEFWLNNKGRLIKKRKRVGKDLEPIYNEPSKAEERIDQEKELTPQEIKALIEISRTDLYLFGIRYFPHYLKKPSSSLHKFLYKTLTRISNKRKVSGGSKIAIAAPRANSKCLEENTEILMYNGKRISIKDVNIDDKVCCVNDNLKSCTGIVKHKILSGRKKCKKIITRSGDELILTDEHRILTFDGWKKAGDLTENDYIASPNKVKAYTDSVKSDYEVKFLAYMIAEGNLTKNKNSFNCNFTNFDKIILDDFIKCCSSLGFSTNFKGNRYGHISISKGKNKPRDFCRENKIANHSSLDKRIPDWVFRLPDRQKKLFIASLWDTDGWVTTKYNCKVGITLANKELIKDIQVLLFQIGFLSFIRYGENEKNNYWRLYIDNNYIYKFAEEIPCILKRDKIYNLCKKDRYSLMEIYSIEKWIQLKNANVWWNKIKSIENYGFCNTYDVQVYSDGVKENNLITNNLISHNSTIISNIFPIWNICYGKKKFIIIISDTAGQAEDFLEDIKNELEHNVKIARDFPQVFGKGPIWKRGEIITKNNIRVLALGSGSRIRGRKFGKDRPDLLIFDDIENDEMVRSKTTREFIRYQWFNKGALNADEAGGKTSDFLFVGTVFGKDSLLNALLDPSEYPGWESHRFKALIDYPTNMDLWDKWETIYKDRFDSDRRESAWNFYKENEEKMLEGSKVLWPEGDNLYSLMLIKISDPSGFECLDSETEIILPDNKIKKICEIQTGDKILSGDGSIQKVINTGTSNLENRKIFDIKIVGYDKKIRVTEDHPLLIYPKLNIHGVNCTHNHIGKVKTGNGKISKKADERILDNKLIWKKAENLEVCDSVVFPYKKYNNLNNSECCSRSLEWYFMVGLYIAEGSLGSNENLVQFSMNSEETDILDRVRNFIGKGTIHVYDNASRLDISSKVLADSLKYFGKLSHKKNLSYLKNNLCEKCFMSLLEGIIAGDGYLTHGRNYRSVNSSSYRLVKELQDSLLGFDKISYLYKLRDKGYCYIENRKCNQRELYQIAFVYENINGRPLQSWLFKNKLYSKIQSIERVNVNSDYKPYWMSVTGEKTFCVNRAIVHNSEKQNNPLDPTRILVTMDELNKIDLNTPNYRRLLKSKSMQYYAALDPSLGKDSSSDFSCLTTVARDRITGYIYIIDFNIKRRSVDSQVEAVLNTYDKYGHKLIVCEDNLFQIVLLENIRKKSRELGIYAPIEGISNYSDKHARIQSIVPLVKDGTIIFDYYKIKHNQQYSLAVDQITTYSEDADHDDAFDSLEMCIRICKKKKFRLISKQNR